MIEGWYALANALNNCAASRCKRSDAPHYVSSMPVLASPAGTAVGARLHPHLQAQQQVLEEIHQRRVWCAAGSLRRGEKRVVERVGVAQVLQAEQPATAARQSRTWRVVEAQPCTEAAQSRHHALQNASCKEQVYLACVAQPRPVTHHRSKVLRVLALNVELRRRCVVACERGVSVSAPASTESDSATRAARPHLMLGIVSQQCGARGDRHVGTALPCTTIWCNRVRTQSTGVSDACTRAAPPHGVTHETAALRNATRCLPAGYAFAMLLMTPGVTSNAWQR